MVVMLTTIVVVVMAVVGGQMMKMMTMTTVRQMIPVARADAMPLFFITFGLMMMMMTFGQMNFGVH